MELSIINNKTLINISLIYSRKFNWQTSNLKDTVSTEQASNVRKCLSYVQKMVLEFGN